MAMPTRRARGDSRCYAPASTGVPRRPHVDAAADTARSRVDARCPSTAGLRANTARTQLRTAKVRHKPQTIAIIVLIPDACENRSALEIPNCLKQLGLYLTQEESAQPDSHGANCTILLQQLYLYLTLE